jgi:hypothetical protein
VPCFYFVLFYIHPVKELKYSMLPSNQEEKLGILLLLWRSSLVWEAEGISRVCKATELPELEEEFKNKNNKSG